ncbi:MAG: homogentisate phytyltransferase [Rhodothermales bacterium]|nr:homogentisate phytyltransferase [Rhodothermales bacterium]
MQATASFTRSLWAFSRPHTIIGTTLSVAALFAIAYSLGGEPAGGFDALAWALVSCLAANVYIVGLNQLLDIDIDRINKSGLPLVSGALSVRAGRAIVAGCLVASVVIALTQGRYLAITVLSSLVIGTAYSAPPIRLKRFHFWAAACIFTVRGLIVNVFLYLHFAAVLSGELGGDIRVPPIVWLLTAFVFLFGLVIAWYKDIPDMQGDRRFKIATLSLRLGPRKVFELGGVVLAAGYIGVAAVGLVGIAGASGPFLAGVHLLLLALARARARNVSPEEPRAMTRYYLVLWGLFYAEYLVFPLAVWLR